MPFKLGFDPESTKDLKKWQVTMAGCSSGLVTRVVVQPLDVLKIRFQLQAEPIVRCSTVSKYTGVAQATKCIIHEEGMLALWKGHIPAQLLSVVYGGVQFLTFDVISQNMVSPATTESGGHRAVMHSLCGSAAACVATTVAYPLDMVRTRLVAQGTRQLHTTMWDVASAVLTRDGVRGMFRGLTPTLIGVAPHAALQFGFYSFLNHMWTSLFGPDSHMALQGLLCGSMAGLVAKLTVQPFDVAKKRLQVHGFRSGRAGFGATPEYRGWVHCLTAIARQEGFRGVMKGTVPSLYKATLSTALHFYFYELGCMFFAKRNQQQPPAS